MRTIANFCGDTLTQLGTSCYALASFLMLFKSCI